MFDDLNARRDANGDRAQPSPESVGNRHDREVPIGSTAGRIPSVVQAWLDGEIPEAGARLGETQRDVEFWSRVNGELSLRRQVRAPEALESRIMMALPEAAPQAATTTTWWSSPMSVSHATAVAAGAGLLAVGALLGAIFH